MDHPGEKLKRARERLKLTYRDIEQASQEIAGRRGNPDFAVSLSRLADIENGGKLRASFACIRYVPYTVSTSTK